MAEPKTINLGGATLTLATLAFIATAIDEDGAVTVVNAGKSLPGSSALMVGVAMSKYIEDSRPIQYVLAK